jgi:hypothetical protein
MKRMFLSYKVILFFSVCFLLLIFFIYLGVSPFFSKQAPEAPQPIPKPTPGNFKTNYSNFDKLVPGKNNEKDVISLVGYPASEKPSGTKTYFYYPTPSSGINNVALFNNGVLVYATEEVFDKYRGVPEDYTKKYGAPEITMYDKNDEVIQWSVFPSHGVAIAVAPFQDIIVKITYFAPQAKKSFMANLSNELGLTLQQNVSTQSIKEIVR